MDHLTARHLLREAGQYFFSDDESIQHQLDVTRTSWIRSINDAVLVMAYPELFPPHPDTPINHTFLGRCRELGPPYTPKRFRPLAIVMHQAPNTLYSTLHILRKEQDQQP